MLGDMQPMVRDVLWQPALGLFAGLAGSYLWRRRSARAHRALLLAVVACFVLPVFSEAARRLDWGLFVVDVPSTSAVRFTGSTFAEPLTAPGPSVGDPTTLQYPVRAAGGPGSDRGAVPAEALVPVYAGPLEGEGRGYPPPERGAGGESFAQEPREPGRRVPWTTLLGWTWVFLSLLFLARLLLSLGLGIRLVARSKPLTVPGIQEMVNRASARLGLRTAPVVYVSEDLRTPVIWCWGLHPALVLPAANPGNSSDPALASVIHHELAHWQRGDHVADVLGEILVCLLPWHPLGWWTKRRLRRLSEQACDDWVLSAGVEPVTYAESLLQLLPLRRSLLVPALAPRRREVAERVHRILHGSRGDPRVGRRWNLAATMAVSILIVIVACARERRVSRDTVGAPMPVAETAGQSIEPAGTIEDREHLNRHLRGVVGITGDTRRYPNLQVEQLTELLEYLESSGDPYVEFNRLGTSSQRFSLLHYLFSRPKGQAAKPYLAQSFLELSCSEENWPPAEANFHWLRMSFKDAGKMEELGDIAETFARERSGDARATAIAARVLSAADDLRSVSPLFDTALELADKEDERLEILVYKANCLRYSGQGREAIEGYEECLGLKPIKEAAWELMELYGKEGQLQELNALVRQALEWFPRDEHVTYEIAGRAYDELGDFMQSEEYFKRSLGALPRGYEEWNISVRVQLTGLYAGNGLPDMAKSIAVEALEHCVAITASREKFESVKQNLQRHADVSMVTFEDISARVEARKTPRVGEILDDLRREVEKAYAEVGLSEEELDRLLEEMTQAGPPQKLLGIYEAYRKASGPISELRRTAAQELAALGPVAVPALLKARKERRGEAALGNVIMEAVIKIRSPAVPYLIEWLSDETWEIRFDAAMALGRIGDRRAAVSLIRALSDPETRVVRAAVMSLGQLKDERAADPLLTLWKEDRLEKGTIADALVAIGDDRVAGLAREELEKLAAEADETGNWEREGHEMLAHVRAVGAFRDRSAIPLLKRFLSAPPQGTKSPLPRYLVAEEAARALRSMGLLVVGDEIKGGYRVVADWSAGGEQGLILFSDGTMLTGKVFLTGPEGDWVRMDQQGDEVVFVARNGEEERYSSNSKWLSHQFVFVKVGEEWRPAFGERLPGLTDRAITTLIFGRKPTESERKEFRKYLWEWVAHWRQSFRKAVGERLRRAAEEERPPGSENWSAEMKTCYRNLLMIGKAADAYVSVFASIIGRMDAEQAAEVEIEELFGYFYLEPPKCPAGGVYSHRSINRSYQHGCSLHGTIEEFGPARKGAFPDVGMGSLEEVGEADESITDHNLLKPAYRHLFQGEYDAAYEEASRISELEGLDPSILVRAYSIMTKALTFTDTAEEEFEKFLQGIIKSRSNDDRPLSPNRPIPIYLYCRILAGQERTFYLKRLGRYREAAEACRERIHEEDRSLGPPSRRPHEEFRIRSILRTDVGDLYRFAGEYEKAAEAYEAALKYLQGGYVDDESLKEDVAIPMPDYLRNKLPRVIAWCTGNPDEIEVKLGREVDTPLELAEWHLKQGDIYKDQRSIQQGLELLSSVQDLLEREDIPDSLPSPLRERYSDVKGRAAALRPRGRAVVAPKTPKDVDAAEEFLGEPKVGVERARAGVVAATSTVGVFPVESVRIWEEEHLRPDRVLSAERRNTIRQNLGREMEKLLMEYDWHLIKPEECRNRIVGSMRKENRPNPLDELAAYPGGLISIIAKYDLELPRETERQRRTYDFHKQAVKAVGEYLRADFILTACLAYEEKNATLYGFFELYETTSAEVVLHVVGAGSYAHPAEGSTAERDCIESGLRVGLEQMQLGSVRRLRSRVQNGRGAEPVEFEGGVFDAAKRLIIDKDYEKAEEELHRIVRENGQGEEEPSLTYKLRGSYLLAKVAFDRERLDEAYEIFSSVVESCTTHKGLVIGGMPNNRVTHIVSLAAMAEIRTRQDRFEEARSLAKEAEERLAEMLESIAEGTLDMEGVDPDMFRSWVNSKMPIVRWKARNPSRSIESYEPSRDETGMVLFPDGTGVTGKVFVTGLKGWWRSLEQKNGDLVVTATDGAVSRGNLEELCREGVFVSDEEGSCGGDPGFFYVFVKTEEGWRPRIGEKWLSLVGHPSSPSSAELIMFGSEPTEAERAEFTDYAEQWQEARAEANRQALLRQFNRKLHPNWDTWSSSSQQCYRILRMIRYAGEQYAMGHCLDDEQLAEATDVESLFEAYFPGEPMVCPAGGEYSHRQSGNILNPGCTVHGTLEQFHP